LPDKAKLTSHNLVHLLSNIGCCYVMQWSWHWSTYSYAPWTWRRKTWQNRIRSAKSIS